MRESIITDHCLTRSPENARRTLQDAVQALLDNRTEPLSSFSHSLRNLYPRYLTPCNEGSRVFSCASFRSSMTNIFCSDNLTVNSLNNAFFCKADEFHPRTYRLCPQHLSNSPCYNTPSRPSTSIHVSVQQPLIRGSKFSLRMAATQTGRISRPPFDPEPCQNVVASKLTCQFISLAPCLSDRSRETHVHIEASLSLPIEAS